jgi:hypothetical protein
VIAYHNCPSGSSITTIRIVHLSSGERETLVVQQGLNREIFGAKRVHCCSKKKLILPARLDVWMRRVIMTISKDQDCLECISTLAAIHSNKER